MMWRLQTPPTASAIEPLKIEFTGTSIGILGEADQDGLGFTVRIDGKPFLYQPNPKVPPSEIWQANTSAFGGGRLFFWRDVTSSLAPANTRS